MVKKNDILPIMIREHCKLENVLDNLEVNAKSDFESMVKSFNNFEWKLEKHIFAEEKIIFTKYNPSDVTEGYKMLPKLTEQHNYILNTINNWREDIRNNKMLKGFGSFFKMPRSLATSLTVSNHISFASTKSSAPNVFPECSAK